MIVHEYGHFIVAKMNGVFVKEFSIGFGPRLISHVAKSGTRFSVKAVLFGGSCIMLGALEDEDDATDDERSFDRKSVWARMSIILAGPVFNFILAFVLSIVYISFMGYDPATVTSVVEDSPVYEAGMREGDVITSFNGSKINFGREIYLKNYLDPISEDTDEIKITYERDGESYTIYVSPMEYTYYSVGVSYYSTDDPAEIAEVSEGSPMEEAGLEAGDIITSINGTGIASGAELYAYFQEYDITEEPLTITYTRRGGNEITATVYPAEATGYMLGFSYNLQNVKTSGFSVIRYSWAELKYEVVTVYKSLWYLISGNGSLDDVSGPVGIVEIVNDVYTASESSGVLYIIMNLLSLMIMLSANLGVINLLPFPAIDGGKFILLVVEAVRRKPLQKKYEGIITMIGAALLVVFMCVVLVNDIMKLF